MWWEQEWHIWAGLLLGAAGLGVGIGAWIYAAKANKKARRIEAKVNDFKTQLEEDLENRRALISAAPAVPLRASLVLGKANGGEFMLMNIGEGPAYDVMIAPASFGTQVLGKDSWPTIEQGGSVELNVYFDQASPGRGAIDVTWIENASEERRQKQIEFPRSGF